jgi:hypothetical protein
MKFIYVGNTAKTKSNFGTRLTQALLVVSQLSRFDVKSPLPKGEGQDEG